MSYKNEKASAEKIINSIVKKLPEEDKQRAADVLLGISLATNSDLKPKQKQT